MQHNSSFGTLLELSGVRFSLSLFCPGCIGDVVHGSPDFLPWRIHGSPPRLPESGDNGFHTFENSVGKLSNGHPPPGNASEEFADCKESCLVTLLFHMAERLWKGWIKTSRHLLAIMITNHQNQFRFIFCTLGKAGLVVIRHCCKISRSSW